jgi:hypothetical protein
MITHPRLVHALLALRPGTRPLVDFIVEDHGNGPTLKDGSMVNPPTQAEVDAVSVADLDRAQALKGLSAREVSFVDSSDRSDLMNRLRTATPAQIDTWIDNNVTSIAAARAVFKAILKVIALDIRR